MGRVTLFAFLSAASLFLTSCASAPAPGAAESTPVQVAGTFTHPSGLTFPEVVGDFKRTSVVQFHGTPDNFGISYRLDAISPTIVTAYVYPAGSASLDDEFRAVVADVGKHHNIRSHRVENITVTKAGASLAGRVASFEYDQRLEGGTKVRLRSHAYVFLSGPWVVKYRSTNAIADDDSLQARVRGLIELLTFPD